MRRYGNWGFWEECTDHCVASVQNRWYTYQCSRHQCFHNRGHGPDGLYCKQHAKMLAAGCVLRVPEDQGK